MATRELLVELLARVGTAWTNSSPNDLPDRLAEAVERVRELWLRIVETLPTQANIAGINMPWSTFLDQSALESTTDKAAVRWERLVPVMEGRESLDEAAVLTVLDDLVSTAQWTANALVATYSNLPEQVRPPYQNNRLDLLRVVDELQAEASRLSIIRTAKDVEEVRNSTRVAAGEIATGDLAQHFESYRASERTQAEVLRGIAAAIIVGTVIALAWLIPGDTTSVEVAQHAAFSVPLFAVAAYLAAESARHRKAAQWAATLRVQLLSVDLFTKPMDPAEAATVRMMLAQRAFGDVPMLGVGAEQKEEAAMPMSLQAVLERLLVELRSKPDKQP